METEEKEVFLPKDIEYIVVEDEQRKINVAKITNKEIHNLCGYLVRIKFKDEELERPTVNNIKEDKKC